MQEDSDSVAKLVSGVRNFLLNKFPLDTSAKNCYVSLIQPQRRKNDARCNLVDQQLSEHFRYSVRAVHGQSPPNIDGNEVADADVAHTDGHRINFLLGEHVAAVSQCRNARGRQFR